MRITSVLDDHPLLALVVAAGRADAVRLLHVSAARARLQRGPRRLVVRAARALLAFRGPALGYRHAVVLVSVVELALQGLERPPPWVGGRRAAAGARVQVLATPRAEAAAVLPAQNVPRGREGDVHAREPGVAPFERTPGFDGAQGQLPQVNVQHGQRS